MSTTREKTRPRLRQCTLVVLLLGVFGAIFWSQNTAISRNLLNYLKGGNDYMLMSSYSVLVRVFCSVTNYAAGGIPYCVEQEAYVGSAEGIPIDIAT